MVDLSPISNITTAANGLANLILVSPQNTVGYQPQLQPALPGAPTQPLPPALLFHYEGEQTVALQSDVTDHYVENNTAVQDQVALRPEKITTSGFIGELNDVAPYGLQTAKQLADKLTVLSPYLPVVSATALLAYNVAFQLYQTGSNLVNSAVASWSSLTNALTGGSSGGENVIGNNGLGSAFNSATGKIANNQNRQQVAFQQFYGYWRNRTLFTVQTPWAVFQNMVIESLRAIQDADTRVISNFEITFKLMRFSNTITNQGVITTSDLTDFQGRAANQVQSPVNLGTITPQSSIPVTQAITGIA